MTRELFIPARVTGLRTYDTGEVRKVVLTLPDTAEIDGRPVPVRDRMHPGAAFLVKPFGMRTQKYRRRMYTRSNCASASPHVLETIINDTHTGKADTSPWWQAGGVEHLRQAGGSLDVRVDYDAARDELVVYQHSGTVRPANLILEPDTAWPSMRIVAVASSTGITPFLSHLRHMRALAFGAAASSSADGRFRLIVSVPNPRRLMEHRVLLDLAAAWPHRFSYHPVLTHEWPDDWPWTTGRLIHAAGGGDSLAPLLALAPGLPESHLRFCGSARARDQLVEGLARAGVAPLGFRSEVW